MGPNSPQHVRNAIRILDELQKISSDFRIDSAMRKEMLGDDLLAHKDENITTSPIVRIATQYRVFRSVGRIKSRAVKDNFRKISKLSKELSLALSHVKDGITSSLLLGDLSKPLVSWGNGFFAEEIKTEAGRAKRYFEFENLIKTFLAGKNLTYPNPNDQFLKAATRIHEEIIGREIEWLQALADIAEIRTESIDIVIDDKGGSDYPFIGRDPLSYLFVGCVDLLVFYFGDGILPHITADKGSWFERFGTEIHKIAADGKFPPVKTLERAVADAVAYAAARGGDCAKG